MEDAEEFSLNSNHDTIQDNKTKRQRPQSPIPFFIADNSSTGILPVHAFSPTTTTTTSSGHHCFQDSTEEDEDMANCLILLAQGQSRESLSKQGEDNYAQYSSRKFLEAAGNSASNVDVYECKTCNRTFRSFQALGGHRASHKKPKNMAMAMAAASSVQNEKRQQLQLQLQQHQFFFSSDEEESQYKRNNNVCSQISLPLVSRGNLNTRSKVHECSICGAVFTSGQALGGHMRRHRAPGNGTTPALSSTPMALEADEAQPKKEKDMLSLELNLNLPAPDDDQKESKFGFASNQHHQQQQKKQQQSDLVFSAPALVDCHL